MLLKIAATLPITSDKCKRSLSVIGQLCTWLRAFVTAKGVSSLVFISIHSGVQTDYKHAVKVFLEFSPTEFRGVKFSML